MYQRYIGVVNTLVNSRAETIHKVSTVNRPTDINYGVPGGNRTHDPLLRRQPLYPLSYWDGHLIGPISVFGRGDRLRLSYGGHIEVSR